MSKKIKTGGAAFPRQIDWRPTEMSEPIAFEEFGMTIRDYFAAQALNAHIQYEGADETHDASYFAKSAYVFADAMLKAREE